MPEAIVSRILRLPGYVYRKIGGQNDLIFLSHHGGRRTIEPCALSRSTWQSDRELALRVHRDERVVDQVAVVPHDVRGRPRSGRRSGGRRA